MSKISAKEEVYYTVMQENEDLNKELGELRLMVKEF